MFVDFCLPPKSPKCSIGRWCPAVHPCRSVAANISFSVDLDLHEKSLHRIGSIWCQNYVESNLYGFFLFNFVFVFRSESILCPFKITAANITWCYVI